MRPADKSSLREVAWLFLKLGTTAFGGPAAHIAMMEDEIVRRRGWLTSEEFLDSLGATNLIPGPNSTEMAIHIGHRRAGWPGLVVAGLCFILPAALIVTAIAWAYVRLGKLPSAVGLLYGVKPVIIATAGIFLPAFIFVALSGPLVPRLRASPIAGAVLDGVNVASLALMAVVTVHLGLNAVVDWYTALLAIAGTVVLFRFRLNSAWLVLGGAAAGLPWRGLSGG